MYALLRVFYTYCFGLFLMLSAVISGYSHFLHAFPYLPTLDHNEPWHSVHSQNGTIVARRTPDHKDSSHSIYLADV